MHAFVPLLLFQAPVALLDPATPQAILRFEARDADGAAIPIRFTFRGEGGIGAALFPRTDAAPEQLAVRKNVVYSLSGSGAISVPTGKFRVFASHGLEYGLAQQDFEFQAGGEYRFDPVLTREVDSTGWVSGDFHLHTLTHSGHGDSNLLERVITLVGEGVEFAVATDHNHNTDYTPQVQALGVTGKLVHVTGNEVSTPIGHLNAFPLDPARPPIDSSLRDAAELFRLIRAESNPYKVVPVIQLNHPRYVAIDWFGQTGLDAVTGTSEQKNWSDGFDSLEVLNANAGSGYLDAELFANQGTGVNSVLTDWFHLLNRGHRHAAVGNSDSHTVHYDFAGFPRNFIALGVDDPKDIRPAAVAQAVRAKRLFTTTGPFVDWSVSDAPMGAQIAAEGRQVSIKIRVQAASWVDVDRVKLVVNGDVRAQWEVSPARTPLRFERETGLDLNHDAWIVVLVEGDEPIDPLVEEKKDRCLPLAITNPVWVDAQADGKFVAPWPRVLADVRQEQLSESFEARPPFEQGLLCLAAVEEGSPLAQTLLEKGLESNDREVLLCAARAAEKLGKADLRSALEQAYQRAANRDAYLRLALVRALAAIDAAGWREKLPEVISTFLDRAYLHASELRREFAWRWLENWQLGPTRTIAKSDLGKFAPAAPDTQWRELPAADLKEGRVSLRGESELRETHVLALVQAPSAREVFFALGADDDVCVWVNGQEAFRHTGSGRTDPPQLFGRLPLIQGLNRIEMQVQNRSGAHGFRLGVLDTELQPQR